MTRPVTEEASAQTLPAAAGNRGFPRHRPSAGCRLSAAPRPTVTPARGDPRAADAEAKRVERRPRRAGAGVPGLGDRKLWGVNGKKWVVRPLRLPLTSLPK